MEPRLTGVNENEALLYLGYRGGPLPEELLADVRRCKALLLETARPRAVYRVCDWDPGAPLGGTGFTPEGRDVREMLLEADRVILLAVTLGAEAEALIRRAQVKNMADAVILDACASAAVENVCDNLCDDLEAELGGFLTDRFSPGYGDFPFEQQPELCRVLDVGRSIGVSLSPGGLMIPQKSVTALAGLCKTPQRKRFRGCAYCNLFESCTYRKEGAYCGRT